MKWSGVFLDAVTFKSNSQSVWFTVLILVLLFIILTAILTVAGRLHKK